MVYLVSVTSGVVIQSLILRMPSVRKALDIPSVPGHALIKPPTFMETVQTGSEWLKNKRLEAEAQARAQQRKKF